MTFDRPVLRFANKGVRSFFILPQTILLGIGCFIMTWKIPDVLKWTLVFTSSFIIIMALYTLLIRKFELLRFIFGTETTHPFFDIFRKKSALVDLHMTKRLQSARQSSFSQERFNGQNRKQRPSENQP